MNENISDNITSMQNLSENNDLFILFYETTTNMATIINILIPFVVLVVIATIAMNTYLLMSVFWIGRFTLTRIIRMSLAAADFYATLINVIEFIVMYGLMDYDMENLESYVDVWSILTPLKLGSVLTDISQLFFMVIHHYIGILWPFKYKVIFNEVNTINILGVLWILPTTLFMIYFYLLKPKSVVALMDKDISSFTDRLIIYLIILVPFPPIFYMYTHILIVLCAQQRKWQVLENNGSVHRYTGNKRSSSNESIHAIYTTIIIISFFILFWGPFLVTKGLLNYAKGPPCYLLVIHQFASVWFAFKSFTNPIIYITRMKEVKKGTMQMNEAIRSYFCSEKNKSSNNLI